MRYVIQLEKELRPEIEKILHHPFLQRIAKGELSFKQLQYFAGQYSIYCYYFPRFLSGLAANIPDDKTRMPIIENLWEEHGCGKMGRSHRQLFNRFLESLDIEVISFPDTVPLKETKECVDTLMDLCLNGNFIESLGAMGPGTEFFTNDEYLIIYNGLSKSAHFHPLDLKFWKVHISLDVEHYSEMVEVLYPYLHEEKNRQLVREGAFKAIRMEQLFWDGLEKNIPN